ESRVPYPHELSPQHTELKANPRQRKRRNAIIRVECLVVDRSRLVEPIEIGKDGAKRHEIFEATARCSDSATGGEHRIESHTAGLIDRQPVPLNGLARCAH